MEAIVPDDQLSLAIGRRGQNVRLAARLSGWKIDVRGESEADEEARQARSSLAAIPGVNDMTAELLFQDGFKSAEELAETDLETILAVEGIGAEKAEVVYKASREHVAEKKRIEEEREVAEKKRIEADDKETAEKENEEKEKLSAQDEAEPPETDQPGDEGEKENREKLSAQVEADTPGTDQPGIEEEKEKKQKA